MLEKEDDVACTQRGQGEQTAKGMPLPKLRQVIRTTSDITEVAALA